MNRFDVWIRSDCYSIRGDEVVAVIAREDGGGVIVVLRGGYELHLGCFEGNTAAETVRGMSLMLMGRIEHSKQG